MNHDAKCDDWDIENDDGNDNDSDYYDDRNNVGNDVNDINNDKLYEKSGDDGNGAWWYNDCDRCAKFVIMITTIYGIYACWRQLNGLGW